MTVSSHSAKHEPDMHFRRYSYGAMLLHWLMALGIFSLFIIGPVMTRLPISEASMMFSLYQLHKSVGITILILAMLRVFWWAYRRPPPAASFLTTQERRLSKSLHLLLYGMMFAVPLLGWALVSTSPLNIPTYLFGEIPWPHLPWFQTMDDRASTDVLLKTLHKAAAYLMLFMLVLHIAAALRHQFILRDGLIFRMLPYRPQAKEGTRQ